MESRAQVIAAASLPAHRTWEGVRWKICALLFFATSLNYIDRQVIGLLKPVLEKELHWREADYGWVVFAFQAAYAAMMPLAGRMIDILGTRLGYMLAVLVWSLAAMGHALASSAMQFGVARFFLGLGESANFPAALKTVTTWFPRRERTLATGIFNSGSNIGAILAPLTVPWMAVHWGWRSAFLITGGAGAIWILLWWLYYRDPAQHRSVSAAERSLIEEDRGATPTGHKVPYARLLTNRVAWAYLIGKFLTDPVWWFFLFWLPGYLSKSYSLNLSSLGLPLVVVYQASTIGSIGGGWLCSPFLRRGWSINKARKTAMLICALTPTPLIFISQAKGNLWLAILLISLGAAAHQGWSANIFNVPGDVFPQNAIASVVGLGGMGGAIGGLIAAPVIGYWLDFSHGSYTPLFVVAGCMYLIALALMHVLVPRLTPAGETNL
jgi:ACS family hexuronate transporter-like MFS transporter